MFSPDHGLPKQESNLEDDRKQCIARLNTLVDTLEDYPNREMLSMILYPQFTGEVPVEDLAQLVTKLESCTPEQKRMTLDAWLIEQDFFTPEMSAVYQRVDDYRSGRTTSPQEQPTTDEDEYLERLTSYRHNMKQAQATLGDDFRKKLLDTYYVQHDGAELAALLFDLEHKLRETETPFERSEVIERFYSQIGA